MIIKQKNALSNTPNKLTQIYGKKIKNLTNKDNITLVQSAVLNNVNKLNYKLPNKPYIKVIRCEFADINKLKMMKKDGTLMDSRKIISRNVMNFRNILRNNEFRPDVFTPTLVNEDYEIISGKHKYQAHLAEDKTHIPVIVIEFLPYQGKKADSWRLIWQSVENSKKERFYTCEDRTDEQIIQTTVTQIKLNYLKHNYEDINKSLIDQEIPSVDRAKYITAINDLLSTNSNTKIMLSYTTDKMHKFIEKNTSADVISTKKDIQKDSDDTINFTFNFKPQVSKDLDNACIFNIINAKIKYPESKIKIYFAIDSCNKEKIISFRNQKLKLIPDSVVKMKKFLENFKPEDIEMIPLPQLPNEVKKYE